MSTVYIFGAGASKAVSPDAPLTADLLPQTLELFKTQHNDRITSIHQFIQDFYFYGRSDLGSNGELPALEEVLSQLDYAIAENQSLGADYPPDKLRQVRENFVYAICEILRQSLDKSSELMNNFLERMTSEDSIISLNYELIIDNAISRHLGKSVDYGVPMRQQPISNHGNGALKLYKLHGSLNWLYCPFCQEISLTQGKTGVHYIFDQDASNGEATCDQCGTRYEPVIITPTMVKSYANILLKEIWRQAEDKMSRADELIFLGYSMPDADVYLKCMFKRAVFANIKGYKRGEPRKDLCPISVIDYDPHYDPEQGNTVRNRYERLFGPVNYYPRGFETFVKRGKN